MRMRRRGERRRVQQYADRGVASVDGRDIRLAVVGEIGDDKLQWIQTHAETHGRLETPVTISQQYRHVARLSYTAGPDRQIENAIPVEIGSHNLARTGGIDEERFRRPERTIAFAQEDIYRIAVISGDGHVDIPIAVEVPQRHAERIVVLTQAIGHGLGESSMSLPQ